MNPTGTDIPDIWRLLASAYDDSEELKRWSALAIEAERRAAAAKLKPRANGLKAKAPPAKAAAGRKPR